MTCETNETVTEVNAESASDATGGSGEHVKYNRAESRERIKELINKINLSEGSTTQTEQAKIIIKDDQKRMSENVQQNTLNFNTIKTDVAYFVAFYCEFCRILFVVAAVTVLDL